MDKPEMLVRQVPSLFDYVMVEYEPSRSDKGVATVSISGELSRDDEGYALGFALSELDHACRDKHGWGLPSVDPYDYVIEKKRTAIGVSLWAVDFAEPAKWQKKLEALAASARRKASTE